MTYSLKLQSQVIFLLNQNHLPLLHLPALHLRPDWQKHNIRSQGSAADWWNKFIWCECANMKRQTAEETCQSSLLIWQSLPWEQPALSPPGRSWAGGGAYRTTSSTAKSLQRRTLWGWTGSPWQHLWEENDSLESVRHSTQPRMSLIRLLYFITNLMVAISTFVASSCDVPSSSASLWPWPEQWWGFETDGSPSCPPADPTDPP